MRVVRPRIELDLPMRWKLEKGQAYVMSGQSARDVDRIATARFGPGFVELDTVRLEWIYRHYQGHDLTDKKILLWRMGGAGDLEGLKVPIQHIKRIWPTAKIILCCDSGYSNLFEGDPHIDEVRHYPVELRWLEEADYHLCFEAVIEENEDAKRLHMVDLFLDCFNFKDLTAEQKIPILPVSQAALARSAKLLHDFSVKPTDFLVGIQMIVDAPIRRYEPYKMVAIAKELADVHGAKIVWFGNPKHAEEIQNLGVVHPHLEGRVINMPMQKNKTWQDSIAMVSRCDVILGGDSSTLHMAGATKHVVGLGEAPYVAGDYQLGVGPGESHTPLVGVFGPFRSEQRLAYYRDALGVDADVACSGCNQHGYDACRLGFPSPCFQVVYPANVLEAVMRLAVLTNQRRNIKKNILNTKAYETGWAEWASERSKTPAVPPMSSSGLYAPLQSRVM